VRVISLLFLLVAGPAFASEGRGLERFAYASPLLSNASFALPQPMREPTLARMTAASRSRARPLHFVAAVQLLPLAPDARPDANAEPALAAALPVDARQPVRVVREVETVGTARPAEQKLAALPEPMHVLPRGPSVEVTAQEPATEQAEGDREARHVQVVAHHRKAKLYRAAAKPAKSAAKKTVPKWAMQMFDTTWQNHAFSYQ
jgi:hypothetical protein